MTNDLNHKLSGGSFNVPVRVLQTFTVHYNAKVDRYYVTDDMRGDRIVSSGHKTVADAVKLNESADRFRYAL